MEFQMNGGMPDMAAMHKQMMDSQAWDVFAASVAASLIKRDDYDGNHSKLAEEAYKLSAALMKERKKYLK